MSSAPRRPASGADSFRTVSIAHCPSVPLHHHPRGSGQGAGLCQAGVCVSGEAWEGSL